MQVALGIGHLHSKQIIYRDLKPENILVGEDGYVFVSDFGISKMVDTEAGEVTYSKIGSDIYMAPEILRAVKEKRGYNSAVDWWAFGTLIYEMIVGRPPFYDANTH